MVAYPDLSHVVQTKYIHEVKVEKTNPLNYIVNEMQFSNDPGKKLQKGSKASDLGLDQESEKTVESIKAIYKKNTSATPSYFLVPLQRAIYQKKDSFQKVYSILHDPVDLGEALVQYLSNPLISDEEILKVSRIFTVFFNP
ncbi:MAG: hypothetical protein HZB76_00965 [Chlamydiae bacterium]|nr:hypothetical protein [Chlamydiota bacterium]